MNNELKDKTISCPYCGESIDILLDCSLPDQQYVEDCQVCCRPINIQLSVDYDENLQVTVTHENE